MKKLTYILFYLVLSLTLSNNFTFAQSLTNEERLLDLEGTWSYQDEKIDFTVTLIHKKINVLETQKSHVLGYIRLIVNNDLICDNLELVEYLNSKKDFDFNEIFNVNYPKRIPPVIISSNEKAIFGGIQIPDKVNAIGLNVNFANNQLVWEFTHYVSRRNGSDATQIFSVPSTWILKRVE